MGWLTGVQVSPCNGRAHSRLNVVVPCIGASLALDDHFARPERTHKMLIVMRPMPTLRTCGREARQSSFSRSTCALNVYPALTTLFNFLVNGANLARLAA
jgi:hypothetical protein